MHTTAHINLPGLQVSVLLSPTAVASRSAPQRRQKPTTAARQMATSTSATHRLEKGTYMESVMVVAMRMMEVTKFLR